MLAIHVEHDHEQHRIGKLVLEIRLPPGLPEKHRQAVIRAADRCSVKKHMLQPL